MAITVASCAENPLLKEWKTPFGVPPFEEIKPEDYLPALKEAIAINKKEIAAIEDCKEEPNFENTILALDRAGEALSKVYMVFGNEESIASTEQIREISTKMSPLMSNHSSEIMQSEKLFARIKAVYDKRESLGLDPDQMRLTTETYKHFERAGSNLSPEDKAALKEINAKIDSLQLLFSQNLLSETGSWTLTISDEEDLSGLSPDFVADAAERAKAAGQEGKWLIGLDNPSVMPFLASADNRELRIKVLDAYSNRCNNNNGFDNKDIVSEIIALKLQRAKIMGYDNSADFLLANKIPMPISCSNRRWQRIPKPYTISWTRYGRPRWQLPVLSWPTSRPLQRKTASRPSIPQTGATMLPRPKRPSSLLTRARLWSTSSTTMSATVSSMWPTNFSA